MKAIELRDVVFRYRRGADPVVNGVSLEVEEGECLAIWGDGKSTLCMLMCGVIPHLIPGVMEGTATVFGRDTRQMEVRDLATMVGVVLQDPENQLFNLTVEADVAFGMENLGVPRDDMEARITEALETVRMTPYRHKASYELSGGQKQRVAIAAVLAMRPRVLILDEPTRELDPLGKEEVFEVLGRLKKAGVTIVIVENDPPRVAPLADRIVLLREGRIRVQGHPREFFAQVLDDPRVRLPQVTEAYLMTREIVGEHRVPLTVEEGAAVYEGMFGARHQG